MKGLLRLLGMTFLIIYSSFSFAASNTGTVQTNQNLEDIRYKNESKVPPYFGIAFHNPNYILPYYYTGSPDNAVYGGETPDGESLKHGEFKYQFSLKVPLWKNIFWLYYSHFLRITFTTHGV